MISLSKNHRHYLRSALRTSSRACSKRTVSNFVRDDRFSVLTDQDVQAFELILGSMSVVSSEEEL